MPVPDQAHSASGSGAAASRRPRIRQRLRTPLEARQWRRRMAGWAIGAVSFVLVVNALVGENGYLATMRKQADQRELAQSLDQLRQENQRMREQIDGIKNDPRELEDAARRYLHMTKPGEKVIIVTPKATPSPLPKSPAK